LSGAVHSDLGEFTHVCAGGSQAKGESRGNRDDYIRNAENEIRRTELDRKFTLKQWEKVKAEEKNAEKTVQYTNSLKKKKNITLSDRKAKNGGGHFKPNLFAHHSQDDPNFQGGCPQAGGV